MYMRAFTAVAVIMQEIQGKNLEDKRYYHSFRGPNVYLAWLQMELCYICSPLKSKVSILGFR